LKLTKRNLIAVILLAVVVYGGFTIFSGYEEIAKRLASFRWTAFAAACALAMGNYLIRFMKWQFYLRRLSIRNVPTFDSLLVFLSGFVLTLTPGKIGETYKSFLLRDGWGIPVGRTASIVVAERITDVIGIIVLIVLGSLGWSGGLMWAVIGGCLVILCMAVIISDTFMEWGIRIAGRLPGKFARRLEPAVRESWHSLRTITTPYSLIYPSLLSIFAWALEGIALAFILHGFDTWAPLPAVIFFYSTATLAGAVIPVPGGLGITEGMIEGQLRLVGGIPLDISTAAMILVRFATLWFSVAIGFAALAWFKARHKISVASEFKI